MRIQTTDRRERLWEDLMAALDEAARFTVRMVDGEGGVGGRLEELLAAADERGTLTGDEINT